MFFRKIVPTVAASLVLSAVAFAQQPQVAAPQDAMRPSQVGPREGRRHGKMGRHERLGFMRELNLTEEQREKHRAIMQQHLGNTKAQREELFKLREKRIAGTFSAEDEARAKAVRQEIHNSMQSIRNEMESTLTPEQRDRLEQLKIERKTHREEMRQRRGERREAVPR